MTKPLTRALSSRHGTNWRQRMAGKSAVRRLGENYEDRRRTKSRMAKFSTRDRTLERIFSLHAVHYRNILELKGDIDACASAHLVDQFGRSALPRRRLTLEQVLRAGSGYVDPRARQCQSRRQPERQPDRSPRPGRERLGRVGHAGQPHDAGLAAPGGPSGTAVLISPINIGIATMWRHRRLHAERGRYPACEVVS